MPDIKRVSGELVSLHSKFTTHHETQLILIENPNPHLLLTMELKYLILFWKQKNLKKPKNQKTTTQLNKIVHLVLMEYLHEDKQHLVQRDVGLVRCLPKETMEANT